MDHTMIFYKQFASMEAAKLPKGWDSSRLVICHLFRSAYPLVIFKPVSKRAPSWSKLHETHICSSPVATWQEAPNGLRCIRVLQAFSFHSYLFPSYVRVTATEQSTMQRTMPLDGMHVHDQWLCMYLMKMGWLYVEYFWNLKAPIISQEFTCCKLVARSKDNYVGECLRWLS